MHSTLVFAGLINALAIGALAQGSSSGGPSASASWNGTEVTEFVQIFAPDVTSIPESKVGIHRTCR